MAHSRQNCTSNASAQRWNSGAPSQPRLDGAASCHSMKLETNKAADATCLPICSAAPGNVNSQLKARQASNTRQSDGTIR